MSGRLIAILGVVALLTLAFAVWMAMPSSSPAPTSSPNTAAVDTRRAPAREREHLAVDDGDARPGADGDESSEAPPRNDAAAKGHVRGVVVDRRGRPVTSYHVAVWSNPPDHAATSEHYRASRDARNGRASLDVESADGKFALDVEPGDALVFVSAHGFRPQRPEQREVVHVRAGEASDVRIVLEASNALRGTVRDAVTKKPIEGARVHGALTDEAHTDADGRFELTSLPERIFSVTVEAAGYASFDVGGIHGERSRDEDVDVELEPHTGGKPSQQFAGVGFQMGKRKEDGRLYVGEIFPGTPADEHLQSGDIIARIDGEDVAGMDVRDAAELMRGQEGTSVRVGIERGGKPIELDIERARITRSDVDVGLKHGKKKAKAAAPPPPPAAP